jgi:hypothetical protein
VLRSTRIELHDIRVHLGQVPAHSLIESLGYFLENRCCSTRSLPVFKCVRNKVEKACLLACHSFLNVWLWCYSAAFFVLNFIRRLSFVLKNLKTLKITVFRRMDFPLSSGKEGEGGTPTVLDTVDRAIHDLHG